MGGRQITTGAVGIVVGFILGFFVSRALVSPPSPLPQAEQNSTQSGELPPDHPSPQVMEQISKLQQRAQSEPRNERVRIALGNAYYDMGRFDGAIRWYQEALDLDPDNVEVRTDLGTSYLYSGNAAKAVEMYRQSLKIKPNHVETLQNIGVAYFSTGRFKEAVESWEKLIRTHPEYPHRQELLKQIENAKSHLEG